MKHQGAKQPIQHALDGLANIGFQPALKHLAQSEGWLLRWEKNGAQWYASRRSLDQLATAVLGWLDARRLGNNQEHRHAHEGEVPKGGA